MSERVENRKDEATGDDSAGRRLSQEATSEHKRSYLETVVHHTAGKIWDNDEFDRHTAQGLKTAALFLRGRVGLAGTLALYAADQAKPQDSFSAQLADAGLGAAKGGLLKGTFEVLGKRDVSVAAKGVGLGVSSRVLDLGLSRQSYVNAQTGQFDLQTGLKTVALGSVNKPALIADVAVFAAAHGMMAGINSATVGVLKTSPFWSTALTGTTFGIASGTSGELLRQQSAGEDLNISKAVGMGLTQGAIDTFAAMPAGAQARAGLHRQFLNSFGVLTGGKNGKYTFELQANGEKTALVATEPSLRGLKEAEHRLSAISREIQTDLTQRFGVEFSKPGEPIELFSLKSNEPGKKPVEVRARAARLDELSGIAAALEHSAPSHLSADGSRGVKFYFYPDGQAGVGALAHFERGTGDRPTVYMKTEAWENKPATERDRDRDAGYYEHRRDSIEALVTHELGHNGQLKMGWDNPAVLKTVTDALGWRSRTDASGETVFELRGKNGEFYRRFPASGEWMRVDGQGQPLDYKGRPTKPSPGAGFSDADMQSVAMVKPVSRYFPNPGEMLVEGLMYFRLNTQRRTNLMLESPTLYELVKNWDQSEINHHYGVGANGQPKMVRLPDGSLTPSSAEAMKVIKDFETN